jgi:hypothetical protein
MVVKLENLFKVLEALVANPGMYSTDVWKKTHLSRKTYFTALKQLNKIQVVRKYAWGKRRIYIVNKTKAGVFLHNIDSKRFGWRFEASVLLAPKLTNAQIESAKQLLTANDTLNDDLFDWECPIHKKEEIVYCHTDDGVFAYCNILECQEVVNWNYVK